MPIHVRHLTLFFAFGPCVAGCGSSGSDRTTDTSADTSVTPADAADSSADATDSSADTPVADTPAADTIDEADAAVDTGAEDTAQPVDVDDVADTADAADTVGECADFSGVWSWTGSCSVEYVNVEPLSCMSQTGCELVEHTTDGPMRMTVEGQRASFSYFTTEGELPCTYVFDGDTVTAHCESAFVTCDATGVRSRHPDATGYCCDVVAQGCGEGQRCQLVSTGGQTRAFTACIPDGDLAEGEPCTRATSELGSDRCAAGLFCSNGGQPSTNQRICQRLCNQNGGCNDDEGCTHSGSSVPPTGFCRQDCEIFGDDCPEGLSCLTYPGLVADADGLPTHAQEAGCYLYDDTRAGASCADDLTCGPHLECRIHDGATQCVSFCDEAHPCAEGEECVPPEEAPATLGVGSCWPALP